MASREKSEIENWRSEEEEDLYSNEEFEKFEEEKIENIRFVLFILINMK